MWSFLSNLLRRPGSTHTVVVMDEEEVGSTRRYQIQPKRLVAVWGVSLLIVGAMGMSLLAFTPLRTFVPGYGTKEMKRNARLNAIRVAALEDSVRVQRHYITRLQQLVTGQVDSAARTAGAETVSARSTRETPRARAQERSSAEGTPGARTGAHEQPAIATSSFSVTREAGSAQPSLSLPIQAPVESGFTTRTFDAKEEHFGIDLAVSEGTSVRSVEDGYVVLADWTQEGGYTVAVQHSGGYLSVYKHNKQLLKQTGDRVKARETIATSGNSGDVTTGPHLHFELWRNGLAQDPRPYITGW